MVKQVKPFKDKTEKRKGRNRDQSQVPEEEPEKDENLLKLGSFHRFGKKNRKPTLKKKVRDLERFLEHAKMDEEALKNKKEQLRELKKGIKDQKEAVRKQDLYKAVKFFERRKIERRLNKVKGLLEKSKELGEEEKKSLENEKLKISDDLFYVKNFPEAWKYIALYPKEDSEDSKKKREELREKIKKMVEFKRKLKEAEAKKDQEEEEAEEKEIVEEPSAAKMDDFFFAEIDATKPDNNTKIQKKVVDKEGNIVRSKPKPQRKAQAATSNRGNPTSSKPLNNRSTNNSSNNNEAPTADAPQQDQAPKKLKLKINPRRYRAIIRQTPNSKPVHMKF